jgi:T5SS/PEP-CTERM-associated repeat protein
VGNGSSRNTLIVSNGGAVVSVLGLSGVGQNSGGVPNLNSAAITGTNSSWSSGYFYLGNMDGGRNQLLVNNGGTLNVAEFAMGIYSSSNRFTLTDSGSSLQCQSFYYGYSGTANQCIISNGAILSVSLASQASKVLGTFTAATVTGANTLWTNAGDLNFGQYSNVLFITAGGVLVDNNGYIENGAGKPNTVVVAGPNSQWNNLGDIHIQDVGGQLLITNGGMVVNNNGYLGDSAGNNYNSVLVSGLGSVWSNRWALYVGDSGASNRLVVADSGKVTAIDLFVGYSGNGNQLVVGNSGLVTVVDQLQISGTGTTASNTVTINGGTMAVTNGVTMYGSGRLTLNSGLFMASFLFNDSDLTKVTFNGGTMQLGATSYYFSPSHTTAFTVGDGTDAALFQMLNNGTHRFSGGLIVSSNASLIGAGTIFGNVSIGNGGTFVPGTTNTGLVTVNGGLFLSPGSTIVLGLDPLSGSAYSVQGMSSVVYAGTLQLSNIGGVFASGQTFKLFDSAQYSGAFDSLVPAMPGPGLRWDTAELTVDGVLRIFSTTPPQPVFSGAIQAGTNLVVSAGSGIAYDSCYLLTSTNLATPLSGWSCIATNYFDVTGAAGFTNAVSTGEPERFFQLRVN